MALTNPNVLVSTTFSGKDISAGASVYQYTHTAPAANCWAIIEFWATVAGSGDYIVWLTKQWAGAGNIHDYVPHTTITLGATTDLAPMSIIVQIFTGDVINVMVDGLAGDNNVSGGIRISSLNPSVVEPGEEMDLVDAPNTTAITAIQSGLAVPGDAMDLIDDAVDAGAVKTDAVTKVQSGLATSANQTTIINRIGAWTGTGVNTILGAFKALLSKAASNPTDVGGTFDAATDSTEAIRDKLDAGVNIVYTAQQLEDAVSGEELTAYRDSSYDVTLEGLGDISSRDKLFFTVKQKLSDDDSEAIIQIEETDGLLYLNKAAIESPITDTDGSITVVDEVTGDVNIHIKAAAMALLSISNDMPYDVATIEGDDKYPKTASVFNILGTATRTID